MADHWDAEDGCYVHEIAPLTGEADEKRHDSERIGSIHENDDDEFLFGAKGGIEYDLDGVRVKDPSFVRYPCWDECRMVTSLFTWGMSQRRPCLLDVVPRPEGLIFQ